MGTSTPSGVFVAVAWAKGRTEMQAGRRRFTRREVLGLGLLGAAAFALPLERSARTKFGDQLEKLPPPFGAELPIPKPLPPTRASATTDFYNITMKKGTASIIPGLPTPIWGYNGQFPGPMISARKGRRVSMTVTNDLPENTALHMHGAYVDGDSDGYPEDKMPPGGAKTYVFPNRQNARTQWFHDHVAHHTATNVYKGLAGLYLIGDEFEDNLPLPKGQFDVPLVVQDRLFHADGRFLYPFEADDHSTNGVEGDVILVNGKPWPKMTVANRSYRLRILNGSNARVYGLALSNGQPLTVIGSEGGLLERPVRVRSLPISPGERYEVVVNFAGVPVGTGPESRVTLENLRADEETTREIMRFDVARRASDDSTVPAVLRPAKDQIDDTHQPCVEADAVRTRTWVFKRTGGFWTVNGKIWDARRVDARPREGDVEVWEFVNNGGGWIHPIHPHLVNFKILTRNGRPPHPWESGYKETVFLDGNDRVRVLIKFPKVPIEGTPGPYARKFPIHCHHIEHEDHDMMAQFEVSGAA
ncbi:multicopper oxidase domain-containing protein [Rubrobacter marinus]|uniref:Multicopper oxidase domain-containing protein n=1 Tax=Rubrobacter marinus TaxID=2653852 RepID=A0A6G8Q1H1_9ACTN|nr:multicopper oxidase domain-containing protein [Rubrobacter marinus]QIN80167.1 multicopper oxidase domain-containing protein [Rubrobacter marinus]